MDELFLLYKTIESVRSEMIQVAMEKGSFTDAKVLELSQRLDTLIVRFHSLKCTPRPRNPSKRSNGTAPG